MEAREWDKIAKDYFSEISSPFESKSTMKPLLKLIKKHSGKTKIAADFGTGVGTLIPLINKNFKKVIGMDFSKKMLDLAEKKTKRLKNVEIEWADLRDLSKYRNKFDVGISINAILMPSLKDIKKSFKEIYKCLKKKGKIILVLPSINSELYRARVIYEYELNKTKDPKKARKNTYERSGFKNYDFLLGIFDAEGKQKHYYRFEIKHRLREVGFKNIKIEKIKYLWEKSDDPNPKVFKEKPKLWDWLVYAEK